MRAIQIIITVAVACLLASLPGAPQGPVLLCGAAVAYAVTVWPIYAFDWLRHPRPPSPHTRYAIGIAARNAAVGIGGFMAVGYLLRLIMPASTGLGY